MARTVIGVFDTREQAESVVGDLIKAGVERNEISFLTRNGARPAAAPTTTATGVDEDTGTGSTAATGAMFGGIGGLLLGLGALAIPGIGPVIAAGPLAAALTGAGIGAAGGAVVGALTESGVSEHDAQFYADRVSSGATLVSVRCDDTLADPATEVMERHGARDVDERVVHTGETTSVANDVEGLTGDNAVVGTGSIGATVVDIPDEEWRNHFRQHYEGQDLDYDYFAPAYRYGAEMARNERYRGRRYEEIESDLRSGYEARHPGKTWDRIKDAVRHGWNRMMGGA